MSNNFIIEKRIPIESITFNSDFKLMRTGEGEYLKATIIPSNASNKSVEWSSEDPDIVQINPYNGYAQAKSSGKTIVIARSKENSEIFGSWEIRVGNFALVSI